MKLINVFEFSSSCFQSDIRNADLTRTPETYGKFVNRYNSED